MWASCKGPLVGASEVPYSLQTAGAPGKGSAGEEGERAWPGWHHFFREGRLFRGMSASWHVTFLQPTVVSLPSTVGGRLFFLLLCPQILVFSLIPSYGPPEVGHSGT